MTVHFWLNWSARHVGLDAAALGGDPRLSCWTLIRSVLASEKGRMLPAASAGGHWIKINTKDAQDFDLLVFGYGGMDTHLGLVVVDKNTGERSMLHLPEGEGRKSVTEPYDCDPWRAVLRGVYRLGDKPAIEIVPRQEIIQSGEGSIFVVGRPFITRGEDKALSFEHGLTVAEIVARTYPAAFGAQLDRMRVTAGERQIAREDWEFRPHAGSFVLVEPLPGIFGLRSILQIGIAIAAITAATLVGGPLGTFASTAILIGGNLALNMLLPPSQGGGGSSDRSPTYAIQGWTNVANPNGAIPAVLGEHRIAPVRWGTTYARYVVSPVGLVFTGAWLTATAYVVGEQVTRAGRNYACISDHTSGATTEPGVGVDWETVWSRATYSADQWNWFLGSSGYGPQEISNLRIGDHAIFAAEAIPQGDGTNIGNMSSVGGLAAAFDGDATEVAADCASRTGASSAYIGKTLDAPTRITKAVVYGSSDQGFWSGANPSVTLNLRAKTGSAPASASDGTLIATSTFTDTADESAGRTLETTRAIQVVALWDHVWIEIINNAGSGTSLIAETIFYEAESQFGDDIDIEVREGYDTDDPLTIVTEQVFEEVLNLELPNGRDIAIKPTIRRTHTDVERAELDFFFPEGLAELDHDGTHDDQAVTVTILYREVGDDTWSAPIDLEWQLFRDRGFGHTEFITFPSRGTYDISVERTATSSDDDEDVIIDRIDWMSLKSIRPEYPINFDKPLALIAVKVKANSQLAGRLDELNYDAKLICLDWNGSTWVERATSNPASLCRWILQGPAKAEPELDAGINLERFEHWHEQNDDLNLRYDYVHDTFMDFEAALAQVAQAGNAAVWHDGSRWDVMIDEPQSVVSGHITPRNGFDIGSSRPREKLPDALLVPFRNRLNNYAEAERTVPFPGSVRYTTLAALDADLDWPAGTKGEVWASGSPGADDGIYLKSGISGAGSWAPYSIDLIERWDRPGLTHPDEVWKAARREEWRRKLRRRRLTAGLDGFDAMTIRPGNLVRLDRGRIASGTTSCLVRSVQGSGSTAIIWVDEMIEQIEGEDYEFRWRHIQDEGDEDPDDPPALSIVRPVVTIAGRSRSIKITVSGGVLPAENSLGVFGPVGGTGFEAIVAGINLGDRQRASVELYDHAPLIATKVAADTPPPFTGRVGEILS